MDSMNFSHFQTRSPTSFPIQTFKEDVDSSSPSSQVEQPTQSLKPPKMSCYYLSQSTSMTEQEPRLPVKPGRKR